MKIGIVILNYLTWEDTVECIESILEQNNQSFEIVIVDNYSNNKSYDLLFRKYTGHKKIHVLQTKDNLGYAKGNNVGIKYCINTLGIKNILVVNNDTVFVDRNYISHLIQACNKKNIGAIGTKVIGSDGKDQNPINVSINFIQILKSVLSSFMGILGLRIGSKEKNRKNFIEPNKSINDIVEKNKILHGCAIFLTENYLEKAQGFYPGTFLYFEENILAIIMEKLDLTMKYTDLTYIYHKEAQSSTISFNNYDRAKSKYSFISSLSGLTVKVMPLWYTLNKING